MKGPILTALRAVDAIRGTRLNKIPRNHPRRVLFLQYETALGPAVHATPVFEAIKASAPETYIAVACSGLTHEVLRYNPHIDELFVTSHAIKDFSGAARDFFRLRNHFKTFNCVATDCSNTRTKIAILAWLSGVPARIGFTLAPQLYHAALDCDPNLSVLRNNLRLLSLLNLPQRYFEPRVAFSPVELSRIEMLRANCGFMEDRPTIALITQTSGGHPKRWPDEQFAEAADQLVAATNCHIVFVGTGEESGNIDRIRRLMKCPSISVAGMTTVPELAALLAGCDLALALDTGPMHVARAAGLPSVVIAAAWLSPHEWLPPNLEHFAILMGRRLSMKGAGQGEFIDDIPAAEVVLEARRMLERYPPRAESRRARIARSLTERPHRTVRSAS